MNPQKMLHDKKQASRQTVARLQALAVGASPEVLSIIDKLIAVAEADLQLADLEYSCHQIIARARSQAA